MRRGQLPEDPRLPDPREATAPEWYRYSLNRLRAEILTLESELNLRDGRIGDQTGVVVDEYHNHPLWLPANARVTFQDQHDPRVSYTVSKSRRSSGVEVYGSSGLVVEPHVSNVIDLYDRRH